MITAFTRSVAQTRALAAALAELVRPGDLVLLVGDLGAGKTAFVQGLAAALGVTDPVTSPTFTLANRYEGRLLVNHLDVYRIEQLAEVLDIGLPELLDEDGVTVIEWGDAITAALPADFACVRITLGEGDDDRRIEFTATGSGWLNRARAIAAAWRPWAEESPMASAEPERVEASEGGRGPAVSGGDTGGAAPATGAVS